MALKQALSQVFRFPLLVLSHQCSLLIFTLKLVLSEGEEAEVFQPSHEAIQLGMKVISLDFRLYRVNELIKGDYVVS